VQVATGILIARTLGSEGRGSIALVLSWFTLACWFGTLGYRDSIQYFIGQNRATANALCGGGFLGSLVVGVLAALLVALAGPHFINAASPEAGHALMWVAWLIPLTLLHETVLGTTLGLRQYRSLILQEFLAPWGYLVALTALYVTRTLSVQNALIAHMATQSLALVPAWVALWRLGVRPRFEPATMKKAFHYGLKLHLGNSGNMVNTSLDRLLIGVMLPASTLGLYTVAITVATLPSAITAGLSRLALAESAAGAEAAERVVLYHRAALTLMIGFAALFVPVALWGLPLVYGAEFRGAVPSALLLLVGLPAYGTMFTLRQMAAGLNRPWAGSQAEGIAAVITVAGLYALVPRIGIAGAALVSSIAYYASFCLLSRTVARAAGLRWRDMVTPLSPALAWKTLGIKRLIERVLAMRRFPAQPNPAAGAGPDPARQAEAR